MKKSDRALASCVAAMQGVVSAVALTACDAGGTAIPIDAPAGSDAREPVDVLWIGAHPDDELYLAPALGERCAELGMRCQLLVLTRGEAGTCKRPSLCSTDLPAIRAEELHASAVVLHAGVEQWDLGDGKAASPDGVVEVWSARSGGQDALVNAIREAVVARSPAQVFTFDPRHGSTCHADHRAAAALVYLALRDLGAAAPPLTFVESVPRIAADQSFSGMEAAVPADSAVTNFDATAAAVTLGGPLWGYLLAVMGAHASQFTDAELAAVAAVPDAGRAVFWLDAAEAIDDDPRYANLCP